MTAEELKKCLRYASVQNCVKFAEPITAAMDEFGIDTPIRQA